MFALHQTFIFHLLIVSTITVDPLHQYENINVPFSTQTSSQYFNYSVITESNEREATINLYYLISGSNCYMPLLTIAVWDHDFDEIYEYIKIIINDVTLFEEACKYKGATNSKYVTCVRNYEIALLTNSKQQYISSLHLQLDPHYWVDPGFKAKITLSCWIPSAVSAPNEMWLNINRSFATSQYHHFSLKPIETQNNIVNDFYYFISPTSEACYYPILSVSTFDTDYDGNDEYLEIKLNEYSITKCYPNSNTCSKYHHCLTSYDLNNFDLGITSVTDFIRVRTYPNGVTIPCKINNTFVFVLTNVTLSCFVAAEPTAMPSESPTRYPTDIPTKHPTNIPTKFPTKSPTQMPTVPPTEKPTLNPTNPTKPPTPSPTSQPTNYPSSTPTHNPTSAPTDIPTKDPTQSPTQSTINPTTGTKFPSTIPTPSPSDWPTDDPTQLPTNVPTTALPTVVVTEQPIIIDSTSTSTIIIIVLVVIIIILVIAAVVYFVCKRKKISGNQNKNENEAIPLKNRQPGQVNVDPVGEQATEGTIDKYT